MAIMTVQERGEARFALPRVSLEMAGFMTLLVGAWAGIVPFVGPLFGFSADGSTAWILNRAHVMLFLLPGAAACLAGLLAMALTPGNRRGALGFAGLLAIACGGWLIVGPVAWPVVQGTAFFHSGAPALRELAYWAGYALGPGGLLVALGAFVLGRDRFLAVPVAARPTPVGRHARREQATVLDPS